MFDVTTKYVKINDERKKVFMIKGDESYVKPTDTTLTIDESSIVVGEVKGFKIPSIVIDVYRNTGSSTVLLYDGEEIIKTGAIANESHQVTFSNVYLAYGIDHELYAVFVGNDSCYESKSKKIKLNVDLPSSLTPVITINIQSHEMVENNAMGGSVSAKINNVAVPDDTPIDLYIDDVYQTTKYTTDGSKGFNFPANKLPKGLRKITARIEDSGTMNGASATFEMSVGYDITFMQYPNTWISGVFYDTKVRVRDWFGNNKTTGSVTFNSVSASVNNDGIATINSMVSAEGNYSATYRGSTSSPITVKKYTPIDITMSPQTTITANGHSLSIPVQVTAIGDDRGMGVTMSHNSTSSEVYLDTNGYATYTYNGNGRGESVTLTATIGTISETITLKDYGVYWTPSQKYNLEIYGGYSEQSSGIKLTFAPNGVVMFNNTSSYNTIEFEVASVMGNATHHYRVGDSVYDKSVEIKKGNKIKLVWTANGIEYYKNGVYDSTYTLENVSSHSNWMIKTNDSSNVRTFNITNIKIY